MKWIFKLTPFLLAISLVVFLYDQNKNELLPWVIWWPLLATLVLAGIIVLAIQFFIKNRTKQTLLASLVVIALLYYGFVYDAVYGFEFMGTNLGRHKYLFPLWTLASFAVFLWLTATKKSLDNLIKILFFSTFIFILISTSGAAFYNFKRILADPKIKEKIEEYNIKDDQRLNIKSGKFPDIYYIIPDAYAGQKVLNKYFNFDNKEFYDYLTKKGFDIARNSRSTYPVTYFSVASTLNMEYVNYLGDVLGSDSSDLTVLRRIIDDNKVLRQLDSVGYEYVHLDTDSTTFLNRRDSLYTRESLLDGFVREIMKITILRPFGGRYGLRENAINDRIRQNTLIVFDSLKNVPRTESPKFIFAHITAPHGPYVFGKNGENVDAKFSNFAAPKDDMGLYLDQLVFVNKKITEVIDSILSQSSEPPIIIIQSDHGVYLPPEILAGSEYEIIKENVRMFNFSAYYLPKMCKSKVPQSMNAVNTFRFIFDQCFGAKYGLLENRSYYYTNANRPYDLLPVDYSKDPL